MEREFEYVILLHGDGQYAPEALPSMIRPVLEQRAEVVFGSRMLVPGEARRGGMPFYKLVGNRILTAYENFLLGMNMSEYHSGYRLYSTRVLGKIPFALNSNDFHFDTEIIVQVHELGHHILEIPMPSYYGEEICYVNGIKYAWNIFRTVLEYKMVRYGLREDARFKVNSGPYPYEIKRHPLSSHMQIVQTVPEGSSVLDIGCGKGALLPYLRERNCRVTGLDNLAEEKVSPDFALYIEADLNHIERLPWADGTFDTVIMADVLEHVRNPMMLLAEVSRVMKKDAILIVSTGNIALFLYRFLLLFGSFPYGKRGILDETHVHLYTFRSFIALMNASGFTVTRSWGTPIPMDLIFAGKLGGAMTFVYYPLVKLWKSLFAYQSILSCKKNPFSFVNARQNMSLP